MTDAPLPHPPAIECQLDLEDLWHDLMGRLGFGSPSLWMLMIGPDDLPLPQLVEVTEAFDLPDDRQRAGLVRLLSECTEFLEPGSRFAFLRTRPGRDRIGLTDRRWAAMLYAAAREAGVCCETVHAANDLYLVPVPWDDLPPDVPPDLPTQRPA